MKTVPSRTIGIIVFDDVLTSEVTAPAEVLGAACGQDWFSQWQVKMIGVEQKPTVKTAEGLTIGVDATIYDDLSLDALIVPGAYNMQTLLENQTLNEFIRKQEAAAEWVGSNCSGAFLLGHSGVLDGKKATTYSGGETLLKEQFPQIEVMVNRPVVIDHRRLTSNGGLVSYQAAFVLLGKLASVEHAHQVYEDLQADRLEGWAAIENTIQTTELT